MQLKFCFRFCTETHNLKEYQNECCVDQVVFFGSTSIHVWLQLLSDVKKHYWFNNVSRLPWKRLCLLPKTSGYWDWIKTWLLEAQWGWAQFRPLLTIIAFNSIFSTEFPPSLSADILSDLLVLLLLHSSLLIIWHFFHCTEEFPIRLD